MKLTNLEIYNTFTQLNENFTGDEKLPIKLNFIFQKNSKTLIELIKEIEAARMEIGKKYGELKEGDYRKFKLRTVTGPDDYASMHEVLTRRFSHGMQEREELAVNSEIRITKQRADIRASSR